MVHQTKMFITHVSSLETTTDRSFQQDAVDLAKQVGVVHRIPCECVKVYIGETGRPMQDRIKEHDRDHSRPHSSFRFSFLAGLTRETKGSGDMGFLN